MIMRERNRNYKIVKVNGYYELEQVERFLVFFQRGVVVDATYDFEKVGEWKEKYKIHLVDTRR